MKHPDLWIPLFFLFLNSASQAQTGLPVWPLASNAGQLSQTIDWRQQPPYIAPIPNGVSLSPGSTGAAFDGCGDLVFYALHTGSGNPNNLFLYAPDGTELLSNATSNGPGLNGVKGAQEIQVLRVPTEQNEWYIIYRQWSTDATAPSGSAAYTPAPFLFSRVRLDGNGLSVLQKDIPLTVSGSSYTYNDGAAVSRTAAGNVNAHYLYLARRALNGNTLSLDRFLIDNTGIVFSANTGEVPATYWNLTHANSHIEISPSEEYIAVCNRNQFNNYEDFFLFDAVAFSNLAVQAIIAENLVLVPDGTANDQSSVLPVGGTILSIAANATLPLRFLQNFNKKLAPLEFSPNGQFLYVTAGGYAIAGMTNITYLAQIDLGTSPLEVRLQVQTTPGSTYDALSGAGCPLANCGADWRGIGAIESAFDGNLYFVKQNDNTLYVIPNPNDPMPQNLVPSDIDLSTPGEPNLITTNIISNLPDQIDGFDYYLSQFSEVAIPVTGEDCDGCRAPFDVQVIQSGEVIETFTVESCPDTLYFCADTSLVYQLVDPVLGISFDSAIVNAQANLSPGNAVFPFSDLSSCVEICDNDIDDDNDGFVDCDDPDLVNDCCCSTQVLDLGPDRTYCETEPGTTFSLTGFASYQWAPSTGLDCDTCAVVTAQPPGTLTYIVTAETINGCISMDTVTVTRLDTVVVHWDTLVCQNEIIVYNGQNITAGSTASFAFTGANGCDSTVVATVDAWPMPIVSATVQDVSCFGETDGAIGLESNDPTVQYSMDGGPFQSVATYSGLAAGAYLVEYSDGNGCVFSLPLLEVIEPPEVVVYLPADTSIQQGQSIGIQPLYNDQPGLSFSWAPPDGLNCPVCPGVIASPAVNTVYILTVQSPGGCTAFDSILIQVFIDRQVFIPNTFSPNFDGINDYFLPFTGGKALLIRDFKIFDRWGALVFDRQLIAPDAKDLGWDGTLAGKPLPVGVYAYYIEVEYADGEVVLYKGGVQLVR